MQIIKSTIPYVIELSLEDINCLHLSCHYYKELLKMNKDVPKPDKRQRLQCLNRMITLIDLMM